MEVKFNTAGKSVLLNGESLTREEEHDHHGVDDGEPVDLDVAHGQVRVPARRPLHLTLLRTQHVISGIRDTLPGFPTQKTICFLQKQDERLNPDGTEEQEKKKVGFTRGR